MRYASKNDFEVLNNSEAVISGDNGVVLSFDYSAKVSGGGITSNGRDVYDIDDVEIYLEVTAKTRNGKAYKNPAVIDAAKEKIEKHILKYFDDYTD